MYNSNVRIGNWYYDLMLQEEKIKRYMRRSRNGELTVQKVRQLFLSLLTEIPLTFPVLGLSYGAVIQIVSPEVPMSEMFHLEKHQGIALAGEIYFKEVDNRCTYDLDDRVIGTGLLTPCIRNVWTLVPQDPTRQGKELRFGDSFHMKLYGSKEPLYLGAPIYSPGVEKGECGHVVPKLQSWMSSKTRFKVVNIHENLRYETEGSTVPPFENIAIMQGDSSDCLAVEADTWFPTYFGMECEVSVHTFKDERNAKKPDPRNFWSFLLSYT